MCGRVTGGEAFAEPLPGHKSWCLSAAARKRRSREGSGGKNLRKRDPRWPPRAVGIISGIFLKCKTNQGTFIRCLVLFFFFFFFQVGAWRDRGLSKNELSPLIYLIHNTHSQLRTQRREDSSVSSPHFIGKETRSS